MNDSPSKPGRRLKLLALGFVLLPVIAGLLPVIFRAPQRAHKQNCLGDMVAINLCGRMWANDHAELMPQTLTEMSNELCSPKVLFCMADPGAQELREQMALWSAFDERRCSYEFVNPGIPESNPTNVFLRCKAHGHLGYVDGSVFDGKRRLSSHEAKFGTPAPGAPSNKF
ncbi:MAG TPA: hypothetical protein VFT34_16410 [Verrucomicrobiae bacterium]|nr:hypothetical protein [Verrucomicrobiae bacterium]